MKRLEEFVSDLAELSCSQVRNEVKERGDDKEWITLGTRTCWKT